MKKSFLATSVLLIALNNVALPQGFIIPSDNIAAIPNLLTHHVAIDVTDQVSKVQIEQEFYNPGKLTIEGIYYFPIPKEATVSAFSLLVDGKELSGELLEKEAAARLYDEIARKNIDPALLEMVDHKFFRAKIFPIPAGERRKIKLTYSQVLSNNDGLVKLVHPLRGNFQSADVPEVFFRSGAAPQSETVSGTTEEITVKIRANTALKNIYSPTHKIEIARQTDNFARIQYGGKRGASSAKDFILYYALDDSDFGLNLLTQRTGDDDGYFMMLISPKVKISKADIINKDLIFVLDISASMVGDKIAQAKEALKFCINSLGSSDYFNIILFSTEVKLFKRELVSAATFKYEALDFINHIEAKGGTNINEALLTALDMKSSRSHASKIVFITDGLPTVGVKDVDEIRGNIKRLNVEKFRIFTFGVGYDVNTQLLDGIAQDSRAVSDYIEPENDIETTISGFYSKISEPVLSALELDYGNTEVFDVYPKELPDLFKGSQLTIVGRYKEPMSGQIKLTGQLNETKKSFDYQIAFPKLSDDTPQLPQLWATRKIGFLLEQIKLNPNDQETKSLIVEVVELSKKYGIVTPFTSYFIHEDEPPRITQGNEPWLSAANDHLSITEASVGKTAVSYSKASRRLQETVTFDDKESAGIRYVGGRSFVQDSSSYWRDLEWQKSETPLHIKYGSEAYFTLLKTFPNTASYLAMGTKVIFKFKNKYVKIDEKGSEEITTAGIKSFFENN